jgi:imidazole glycerol phosphate synthase glutamine amidotransferase subunit
MTDSGGLQDASEPVAPGDVRGDVVIVTTGVANLASIMAAFRRLGVAVRLTEDPDEAREAARLVVPGVGAFGAAMERLETLGMVDVLRRRIHDGLPLLAVCVGLQVLFDSSEESPGARGISAIPGCIRRFSDGVRIPQFGWNLVRADPACRFLLPGHAYFANSYRLDVLPDGWFGAVANHGGPFVAALEKGNVLACQFHPELSGAWGMELLRRWLIATSVEAGC